jgi:hypothetical protein
MFRGLSRKKSRQIPYYNGTNYVSRPVYQYGEGLEILDEMPRFIPREEIQDIMTYLQNQITTLKSQVVTLTNAINQNGNSISTNASNIATNASNIATNEDNLDSLETYVYSGV